MTGWLDNPALQSAALPFAAALLLGVALRRTRLLALLPAAALVVLLALTVGFALEPLTAVKKLALGVFAGAVLAAALDAAGARPGRGIGAGIVVFAAAAALWALQRLLAQQAIADAMAAGAGAALFTAAVVLPSVRTAEDSPLRGAVLGAGLGFGSGALALLGASALLAQIGIALGSACAAAALLLMWRGGEVHSGWSLMLPAALGAALVGVLAVATAELRWPSLLPLLAAPWIVRAIPLQRTPHPWQQAAASALATTLPLLLALAIAWHTGGTTAAAG